MVTQNVGEEGIVRRRIIVACAASVLLAYCAGYCTRGYISGQAQRPVIGDGIPSHEPRTPRLDSEPKSGVSQQPASDPRRLHDAETESLRGQVEELRRQLASADDSQQQAKESLATASTSLRRYDWFKEQLKQGRPVERRAFGFNDSLHPSDKLTEFLELDERQTSELEQVCGEALTRLQEWEYEHAVLIEESEGSISFDIPAIPVKQKAAFVDSLAQVLEEMDVELLSSMMPQLFSDDTSRRGVTFLLRAKEEPNPDALNQNSMRAEGDTYELQITHVDAGGRQCRSSKLTGLYTGANSLPERWRHLFCIEE